MGILLVVDVLIMYIFEVIKMHVLVYMFVQSLQLEDMYKIATCFVLIIGLLVTYRKEVLEPRKMSKRSSLANGFGQPEMVITCTVCYSQLVRD